MLFRVENNQENGGDGKIRNYELSRSELPKMKMLLPQHCHMTFRLRRLILTKKYCEIKENGM